MPANYYDGSSWSPVTPKVWDGSQWVEVPVEAYWEGSWVTVHSTIGYPSPTWEPGSHDGAPNPTYDNTGVTVEGSRDSYGGGDWRTNGNWMDYWYNDPDVADFHFDLTYNVFTNSNTINDRGNYIIRCWNAAGVEIFRMWRNYDQFRFLEEPGNYTDMRNNSVVLFNISTGTTYDFRVRYNEDGNNEWRIYVDGTLEITAGDNMARGSQNDPIDRWRFQGFDSGTSGSADTEVRIDYKTNDHLIE